MRNAVPIALVLLICGRSPADDVKSVLLKQPRAWRGVIEVDSRRIPHGTDEGEEIQTERAEFIALTNPRSTLGSTGLLKLRMSIAPL